MDANTLDAVCCLTSKVTVDSPEERYLEGLGTDIIYTYDVDHGCMKLKPVDVNVPLPCLNAAVHIQTSQTATTLAVVFELFSTKQEKLIKIGLHCLHTNLVFSEVFKKPNPVFR